MPVNEENPLLLVSIYAQTKNTEWMTDPTGQTVPKGVPAQGNLTVTGVWDMIPDDLKPHTAIQLHGDDFVGHGYGGNGDHDALWAWYGYFVDQAEEYNRNEPDTSKHINLYLTLMTGGTPISVLNRTVPDDELTQFIAEHDCITALLFPQAQSDKSITAHSTNAIIFSFQIIPSNYKFSNWFFFVSNSSCEIAPVSSKSLYFFNSSAGEDSLKTILLV